MLCGQLATSTLPACAIPALTMVLMRPSAMTVEREGPTCACQQRGDTSKLLHMHTWLLSHPHLTLRSLTMTSAAQLSSF
jgi:hypothetical protein